MSIKGVSTTPFWLTQLLQTGRKSTKRTNNSAEPDPSNFLSFCVIYWQLYDICKTCSSVRNLLSGRFKRWAASVTCDAPPSVSTALCVTTLLPSNGRRCGAAESTAPVNRGSLATPLRQIAITGVVAAIDAASTTSLVNLVSFIYKKNAMLVWGRATGAIHSQTLPVVYNY